jgi:cardiolipin synthase A/B
MIPPMCKTLALLLVALLPLGGCKSLPRVDNATAGAWPVRLEGANGPLSAGQSHAILDGLKGNSGATDILDKHLALVREKVGRPLLVGNRVDLLQDDAAIHTAMFAALRGARNHIELETYIFEDDEIGRRYADLLLEKQAEGVEVDLIYDSIGSLDTPRLFFDRLERGGIRVLEYNPVNPLLTKNKLWLLNNRDHRKLLVVDGRIAFIGSVNMTDLFSRMPDPRSGQSGDPGKRPRPWQALNWRETDIRIEGPVVAEFQRIFLDTWRRQHGPPLAAGESFPSLSPRGREVVLALGSSADNPDRLAYVTLLSAIESAEHYVRITNAYFVPDPQLIRVLKAAARRGVEVSLILPSESDSWLPLSAGRSHYTQLLKSGVRIYQRQDAVVHAKTAVIDGVWSWVGSTNLDRRSFLHNDEVDAVILGRDFARQMDAWFAKDLAESDRIELGAWRRRGLSSRLKEWVARLWEYWL